MYQKTKFTFFQVKKWITYTTFFPYTHCLVKSKTICLRDHSTIYQLWCELTILPWHVSFSFQYFHTWGVIFYRGVNGFALVSISFTVSVHYWESHTWGVIFVYRQWSKECLKPLEIWLVLGFPRGSFFCDLIIDYEVLTYFNTGMSDVLLAGY